MEKCAPQTLPDHLKVGLSVVFIGINPGLRSAELGHHYAGHANRFWKLLNDAGFSPDLLTFHDDGRLPTLGVGLTNLVSRPTKSVQELTVEEYRRGLRDLGKKMVTYRPRIMALLGLGMAKYVLPPGSRGGRLRVGLQEQTFQGIPVFVLPNPSGRNAHYSYDEMKTRYRELKTYSDRLGPTAKDGKG